MQLKVEIISVKNQSNKDVLAWMLIFVVIFCPVIRGENLFTVFTTYFLNGFSWPHVRREFTFELCVINISLLLYVGAGTCCNFKYVVDHKSVKISC